MLLILPQSITNIAQETAMNARLRWNVLPQRPQRLDSHVPPTPYAWPLFFFRIYKMQRVRRDQHRLSLGEQRFCKDAQQNCTAAGSATANRG